MSSVKYFFIIFLFCSLPVLAAKKRPAIKSAPAKSGLAYQTYTRGVELVGKKKFDDAVRNFKAAIEMNPRFTDAYVENARALVLLGKRKEGLASLSEGLLQVRSRDDRERLANERQNLSEIFYTNEVFQEFQNGLNYLTLERLGSAVDALEQAKKKEPDNVLILSAYARALQEEGKSAEALKVLSEAHQLNETNFAVKLDLVEIMSEENPGKALDLLQPVLNESNEERIALLEVKALNALQKNTEALDFLKDRAEKQQNWILAQYWLGKLYSQENNGAWNARKYLMTFLRRSDPLLLNVEKKSEVKKLKSARLDAENLLLQVNKKLE